MSTDTIERLYMPSPLGLSEMWKHESSRTLRLVSLFKDNDLLYRPSKTSRTVGELIHHLCNSYHLTEYWLHHSSNDKLQSLYHSDSMNIDSLRNSLQFIQKSFFDNLSSLDPDVFDEWISPFGTREKRGIMALGMFKHELHHRGELSILAHSCNHQPPNLYESINLEQGK